MKLFLLAYLVGLAVLLFCVPGVIAAIFLAFLCWPLLVCGGVVVVLLLGLSHLWGLLAGRRPKLQRLLILLTQKMRRLFY